jgi:hypothetical protein
MPGPTDRSEEGGAPARCRRRRGLGDRWCPGDGSPAPAPRPHGPSPNGPRPNGPRPNAPVRLGPVRREPIRPGPVPFGSSRPGLMRPDRARCPSREPCRAVRRRDGRPWPARSPGSAGDSGWNAVRRRAAARSPGPRRHRRPRSHRPRRRRPCPPFKPKRRPVGIAGPRPFVHEPKSWPESRRGGIPRATGRTATGPRARAWRPPGARGGSGRDRRVSSA